MRKKRSPIASMPALLVAFWLASVASLAGAQTGLSVESRLQRLESFHNIAAAPPANSSSSVGSKLAGVAVASPQLYARSRNILQLQGGVALEDLRALGGELRPLPGASDRVAAIPQRGDFKVVSSRIDADVEQRFSVIAPPRPQIVMTALGRKYNGASFVTRNALITIEIEPDASFEKSFPDDADYQIGTISVLVGRSLGTPIEVASFAGGESRVRLSLKDTLDNESPGTAVFLRIADVKRINHTGERLPVEFSPRELTIAFVIR